MRTKLHLVSMPWANPELPSIQTGALKAYIDSVLGDRVVTRTYSAFANILLEQNRGGYTDYYDKYQEFEEYPYFMMYYRRFLRADARLRRVSDARLIRKVNDRESNAPLTLGAVARLERRTRRYIESSIAPHLSRRDLNVVGFTLNYFQLYASLYCARYLRERFPGYEYLFVFGGATVIYPKVAEVLKGLGVEGLCVIGEGERKLELILREVLAAPAGGEGLAGRLARLHEGIYDIQRREINLYDSDPARLLGMQTPMESLPLPDFGEYYASLRRAFPDPKLHAEYKAGAWLALEGSRGCFAHCDFCDVHTSWSGFRKSTPERILDSLLELARRHRNPRVKFMDNVCDTWAERYAELLIERKIRIAAFMECRVHHPEVFWTKLSLAGVELVQVGIEAFSPSLIRAMNKGTRAKQNLLVQKWLKELGINSLSNIITHHPKSTLRQVEETKRVLKLIPHLDRLYFSPLALLIGSPLEERLRPGEKTRLAERQRFDLPSVLDRHFVLKGEYEPPEGWFGKGVYEAWDRLGEWEEQFRRSIGDDPFMTAARYGPGEVLVRDGRYGGVEEHHLTGNTARVYQLCHQGATAEGLSRDTGLPAEAVGKSLRWLTDRQLLAELDGYHVALALRPRDELIANYVELSAPRAAAPRALQRAALPVYQPAEAAGAVGP